MIQRTLPGTWLVRLDASPVPTGKTWSDVAVAVHHHGSDNIETGWWNCMSCGSGSTSRDHCEHVRAVQADEAN